MSNRGSSLPTVTPSCRSAGGPPTMKTAMSVENVYLSADWEELPNIDAELPVYQVLCEAIDTEDWICEVPFGSQIDAYYFSSTRAHIYLSDWFREAKGSMDRKFVYNFSRVFTGLGLLADDNHAFVPFREPPDGFEAVDDWLLGVIPPARVVDLLSFIGEIDLDVAKKEIRRALRKTPAEGFPENEVVVSDWIAAANVGLQHVADAGWGIIIGSA